MIKSTSIFALLLTSSLVLGQQTWHVKLPFSAVTPIYANLYPGEQAHLVSSHQRILQIGDDGVVTGSIENLPNFVNSIFPRKDAQSGRPYFYIGRRGTAPTKYYLSRFEPGIGIVKEQAFDDSLFSMNKFRSPTMVSANDSSFLVFGNKYARKITYHRSSNSFDEDWVKPSGFEPIGAVLNGNSVVVSGLAGTVKAFDLSGNLLWEQFYAFETRTIKLLADGFALIGLNASQEPSLLRLDLNGNLLWDQLLPAKSIADLTPTLDGGFALTGQTTDDKVLLLKLNAQGAVLWNKVYPGIKGLAIQNGVDAGLVMLYQGTQNSIYLLKTNDLGENLLTPTPCFIKDRELNNGGFSLTQIASSSLFFDNSNSTLHIPPDSATATLFAHCPWLGARDGAGNLYTSVSTYGESFKSDFRLGIASSNENDFARVWLAEKKAIEAMRKDFSADGHLDQVPPADILYWPAKGNLHFQQNLDFTFVSTNKDSLPAPFVDLNQDGIYNVYDGDYPKIKGDRMLWWAITDVTPHDESNGVPLVIDMLISVYGYDCPENEAVWRSVFADYEVINRSGQSYSNAYFGFHTDPDLGCSEDDFLGSIPDANASYVYNADALDGQPGTFCAGGIASFGDKVPVESITMLNQTLNHAMYLDRTGLPPTGQNDPVTPLEYYNFMQSIWGDGTHLSIGGTGYNPQDPSAVPTNFIFPDNPADPQGWSMCTSNIPLGDRRMINTHGPFNFAAGDTFLMRLAFTFHADIPHPCPNIESLVKPTILQIQQWHGDGTLESNLDLGGVLTLPTGQSLTLNANIPAGIGYLWSTGASTSSITVSQAGEYTVTVTRGSGCDLVETVLVKAASGTHAPALIQWQLQPNPATEVLHIMLEATDAPATAILRNALGQEILRKSSLDSVLDLQVIQLPAGLYWAELWREGQLLGTKKVMLAKD